VEDKEERAHKNDKQPAENYEDYGEEMPGNM